MIGIIAGAFSGATIGHRFGIWLDSFPVISPYGNVLGVGITVICITYLSVVMGELVPKQIAFTLPERFAALIAQPMQILSWLFTPIVWLLHASSKGILTVLGLPGKKGDNSH